MGGKEGLSCRAAAPSSRVCLFLSLIPHDLRACSDESVIATMKCRTLGTFWQCVDIAYALILHAYV